MISIEYVVLTEPVRFYWFSPTAMTIVAVNHSYGEGSDRAIAIGAERRNADPFFSFWKRFVFIQVSTTHRHYGGLAFIFLIFISRGRLSSSFLSWNGGSWLTSRPFIICAATQWSSQEPMGVRIIGSDSPPSPRPPSCLDHCRTRLRWHQYVIRSLG